MRIKINPTWRTVKIVDSFYPSLNYVFNMAVDNLVYASLGKLLII